jgi:transmembrane sensor
MNDVQAAGHAGGVLDLSPPRLPAQNPLWIKSVPVLAAASILGLLIAAGILFQTMRTQYPQMAGGVTPAPFVTKVGEVRTVKLADGSQVVLDTDTAISVAMTADRRDLILKRGRARFIVAHDAARPFFVKAGGMVVRATGTVFDVLFRSNVAVHLIEGGVEVELASQHTRSARKILLRPGQILAFSHGHEPQTLVIPARRSDEQWVNGVKSFDNVPIREVIAEANSYSDTRIELMPPSLGDREIFADIHIRDIERVAEAISGFLDLDIDRTEKGRLILSPRK